MNLFSNVNKKVVSVAFCFVVSATLAACANKPVYEVDATGDEFLDTNPEEVVAQTNEADGDVPSGTVVWGGVIVSANNLSDRTQLEVLSYPLAKDQRPITDKKPTGRFLIQSEGYMELANYQQGRLITVLGTVQDVTEGTVGDVNYQYPTITSNEMHLWLKDEAPKTGIIFGIGISLGG